MTFLSLAANGQGWNSALKDVSSTQFQTLADKVQKAVRLLKRANKCCLDE
jgi:hypothetical protein